MSNSVVFEPSLQEFGDPHSFIENIRPIAERKGICVIRPPKEWKPTCCLDFDHFSFTADVKTLPNTMDRRVSGKEVVHGSSGMDLTVTKFGMLADKLKSTFFNMPVNKVSHRATEETFWQLMDGLCPKKISVYTARLVGNSAFPTADSEKLLEEDKAYIDSPWNSHKLSKAGVFRNIKNTEDISHPKSDCWLSMCFSNSSWQTASQWGYSVAYLHWGEPRTWYAVSGDDAEKFDLNFHSNKCVDKSSVFNPNLVQSFNIQVHKVVQNQFDFVVVFPRAYHMWFSHGFNLVESVNFFPTYWLPVGLACQMWHQSSGLPLSLPLEEVLCSLWSDRHDVKLAPVLHRLLKQLYNDDQLLIAHVTACLEITETESCAMELLSTVQRRCCKCQSVCFLSAVICQCSPNELVCCRHVEKMCKCSAPRYKLLYRYSKEAMADMLEELDELVNSYSDWSKQVVSALQITSSDKKYDLAYLKTLQKDAIKDWRKQEPYRQLVHAISLATQYSNEARKFLASSRKRRDTRGAVSDMLTFDDLLSFADQIMNLPCKIPEADQILDILSVANAFKKDASYYVSKNILPTADALLSLIEQADDADVLFEETPFIKQWVANRHWLDEVNDTLSNSAGLTVETMKQLCDKGASIPPHAATEPALINLQRLMTTSASLDSKARQLLVSRPSQNLAQLQAMLDEASCVKAHLPNVESLRKAVDAAKIWIASVDKLLSQQYHPYVNVLESYVNLAHSLPVQLERLPQLDSCVTAARAWYERVAKTFVKKHSSFTLLELLTPRTDIGTAQSYKVKRHKPKDVGSGARCEASAVLRLLSNVTVDDMPDAATLVMASREDQANEIEAMLSLRALNVQKLAGCIDASADKYCLCRNPRSESMIQCELCKDLFHPECVSLSKQAALSFYSNSLALEAKYLCPMCQRSRRPRLESALTLLLALQKLPVRIACGEALQLLAERAMVWQEKAKRVLTTSEVAMVLARVSDDRSLENLSVHPGDAYKVNLGHRRNVPVPGTHPSRGEEFRPGYRPEPPPPVGSSMMPFEHAYSSVSKHYMGSSTSHVTGSHGRRTASLSPVEPSSFQLSAETRKQVEDIAMEGDLLEVALDETFLLWKVLRVSQPNYVPDMSSLNKGTTDILSTISQPETVEELHRKRRKHLEVRQEDSQMEVLYPQKKQKVKESKFSRSGSDDLKRNKSMHLAKRKKQKQLLTDDDDDDFMQTADASDDDCSAVECLKPLGREVNWVQCDVCQLWFHLICVGLSKNDVSDDKEYVCQTCSGRKPRSGVVENSLSSAAFARPSPSGHNYSVNSGMHALVKGSNTSSQAQTATSYSHSAWSDDMDYFRSASRMQSAPGSSDKTLHPKPNVQARHEALYDSRHALSIVGARGGGGGSEHLETLAQKNVHSQYNIQQLAVQTGSVNVDSRNSSIVHAPSMTVYDHSGSHHQVVYMYADANEADIDSVEDMVEVETDLSIPVPVADESAGQMVEEDSEACHELTVLDTFPVSEVHQPHRVTLPLGATISLVSPVQSFSQDAYGKQVGAMMYHPLGSKSNTDR